MSNRLMCSAAAAAVVCFGAAANAQPAYSFETILAGGGPPGPDGFFGLGAAVSQESVLGVTHLEHSMRYDAGAAGFVGARTEFVPPALNNPPGVEAVLFDVFIPSIPAGLNFADIGVTIFGHDIDNGVFGVQAQFMDLVSLTGLGAGQHLDQRIDLDSDFFSGQSFNDLYGNDVSDLDVASAFQFYMSKNAGVPVTVYIDNVRFVVPGPGAGAVCAVGMVMMGARRRR